MIKRREFLKASAVTTGSLLVPWKWSKADMHESQPSLLDPEDITKFNDPLPIPAVLEPTGDSDDAASYQVTMSQFQQQVLPADDGFETTTVWGYEGSFPGPTIEARQNKPVSVKWINELPMYHLFPIDTTLHGSEPDKPEVRTVVHLHGAHTKPQFDGYPEEWYTSNQRKNFAVYNYKNDQEPAALWYHDHAVGNTRLNVYAGLAGLYNIRDETEDALNLPSGDYEIPLVIQDRIFTSEGELFYPSTVADVPFPSVIPVLIGDVTLVNGKSWPYLEVEPRMYRFRVLNGSNSRPYRLRLVPDDAPGTSLPFLQIGTDGGLLFDGPVEVGKLNNGSPKGLPQVTVAPAERADIVVDFSTFAPGKKITMRNLGINDFPSTESVTFIMQFQVIESSGVADTSVLPTMLPTVQKLDPADAVKTRYLTLDKDTDSYGRAECAVAFFPAGGL